MPLKLQKEMRCDNQKCADKQPILTQEFNNTSPFPEPVRELVATDLNDLKLTLKELQEQYSTSGSSIFHPEPTLKKLVFLPAPRPL